MKKGYFFSLEVLIAVLVIVSSLLIYTPKFESLDIKNNRIYDALDLLEKQNKIDLENLESNLENLLDFNVEVDENCKNIKYLLVLDSDSFQVVNVCY
jgi:hypothetical protein